MNDSYWNRDDKELDLEDGHQKKPWWSSRPFLILSLAVVSIGALSLLWHTLLPNKPQGNVEVPYIKAEETPLKTRPENPGGAEIPHQDKRVYDLISDSGASKQGESEHLAPAPEKPAYETHFQNPSELSKGQQAASVEAVSSEESEERDQEESIIPEEDLKKTSKNKGAEVKDVKTSVSGGKAYRLQLAALASQKLAEGQIKSLKKKFPSLRNLPVQVFKATVKGKNFYRVQFGSFSSKEKALKACKAIKDKGGDCHVVRS